MLRDEDDTWWMLQTARDAGAVSRTLSMLLGTASWRVRFGCLSSPLSLPHTFFQIICRTGSRQASLTRALSLLLALSFGFFGRRAMRQSLRINLRQAISSAYESFIGSPGFERQ
ncbi:hypothetical protein LINPERHAP1_LOCUS38122 [Linum perenne]